MVVRRIRGTVVQPASGAGRRLRFWWLITNLRLLRPTVQRLSHPGKVHGLGVATRRGA